MSKVCLHQESDGSWIALGEIRNNSGEDKGEVDIDITFLDSGGTPINEGFDSTYMLAMPSGTSLPFIVFLDLSDPPALYRVVLNALAADLTPRTDLQWTEPRLTRSGVNVTLSGKVCNPGADVDFVDATAAFYNSQGLVVAIGYESLDDGNSLGPCPAGAGAPTLDILAGGVVDAIAEASYSVILFGYAPN